MTVISYTAQSALTWTPWAACTVVLGLRLWLRARVRNIGAEDYLMALSWCCITISAALSQKIELMQKDKSSMNGSVEEALYKADTVLLYFSLVLGRASVATLLLHIIGRTSRWRRWLIITALVLNAIMTILIVAVALLPPCGMNSHSITNGECSEYTRSVAGIVQAWNFYCAFIDITYSLIPLTIFPRLQTSLRKKVCLSFLLSLGWATAVLALLRFIVVFVWPSTDTYFLILRVVSCLESPLIIICGSLGTLAPIVDFWTKSRRNRTLAEYHMASRAGNIEHGRPTRATSSPRDPYSHLTDDTLRGDSHDEPEPPFRVLKRTSINMTSETIA